MLAGAPPPAAELAPPAVHAGPAGRVAVAGPWEVALDPRGAGSARGFQVGAFRGRRVTLPYVPNAFPVTGRRGSRNHLGSLAWYRTTLRVPENGDYALGFASVNHRASVWIDGRLVASHTGVYLPFEAEARLTAGDPHTLVVRADYRDPIAMKDQGWHRSWFNFGGIDREVTLRRLGASELRSPLIRTQLTRHRHAVVDVSVRVHNRIAARPLRVEGALVGEGRRIPLSFPEVPVPEQGRRVVQARAEIADPRLWSPAHPQLYELELKVGDETA